MNDLYMRMNEINDEESLKEGKERLVERSAFYRDYSNEDIKLTHKIFDAIFEVYPIMDKWYNDMRFNGYERLESMVASLVTAIKKEIPLATNAFKELEDKEAKLSADFLAHIDDDIRASEEEDGPDNDTARILKNLKNYF